MQERVFNKNFTAMLITGFLIYMSLNMITPILSRYAYSMHSPESIVGLLSGMFAFSALAVRPVSGVAVDVINKRKLLILSFSMLIIAFIGYSFSKSVSWLFVFRILHGASWGFGSTTCMTVAIDSLPKQKFAIGIGIYGMAQQLANAISPSIGLYLSNALGYRPTFLFSAIMASLALIFVYFFIDVKSPARTISSFKEILNLDNMIERNAVLPASITLVNTMATAAINTFLVIYADSIGILNIGLYFTLFASTMLILRPFMSALIDKVGLVKVIVPCEIFVILGLFNLMSAITLPRILLTAFLMAIGISGAQPGLVAECVNSTTADRRGVASSTNYIGTDIGNFSGSFLSGIIVPFIGFNKMFAFFSLPILLMILLFVSKQKRSSI